MRRTARPHPGARNLGPHRSSHACATAGARCRSARSRETRLGDRNRRGRCRRCARQREARRRRCSLPVRRAAVHQAQPRARSGTRGQRMRHGTGHRSRAWAAARARRGALAPPAAPHGMRGSWAPHLSETAVPRQRACSPRGRRRSARAGGRTAVPPLRPSRELGSEPWARLARRLPGPQGRGRPCRRARRTSSAPARASRPRHQMALLRGQRTWQEGCSWGARRTRWSAARMQTRRAQGPSRSELPGRVAHPTAG